MPDRHDSVNALPPELAPSRLADLAAEYRQRLQDAEPGGLPDWYIQSILDAITARLSDRPNVS
jgi:hypothetical protein